MSGDVPELDAWMLSFDFDNKVDLSWGEMVLLNRHYLSLSLKSFVA